jgi:hypothetical protein
MTLSLYSTYRALQREARANPPAASGQNPIQNSVCHALALLGMGVEGVSCGGDFTAPTRATPRVRR